MAELTVFNYRPGSSILHRLDVRAKIFLMICISLVSLQAPYLQLGLLTGVLFGLARVRTILWLQLLLNITNGVLNVTFVVGLGMGVSGVALGTLIAQVLTAVVSVWMMFRIFGTAPLIAAARDGDGRRQAQGGLTLGKLVQGTDQVIGAGQATRIKVEMNRSAFFTLPEIHRVI